MTEEQKSCAKQGHRFERVNRKLSICSTCGLYKKGASARGPSKKAAASDDVVSISDSDDVVSISDAAEILGITNRSVTNLKNFCYLEGPYGMVTKASLDLYINKPHKEKTIRRKGVHGHATARLFAIKNHSRIVVDK